MDRTILHSDLNNFFASVECARDASLKDVPVAVAGDEEMRHGVVLAKNYIAKGFGITTGEPIWSAKRKCKDLVLVPPHYEDYVAYSRAVREIYLSYTDQVEPFSIDECWLDVTASRGLFGNGKTIADDIRARIARELGVTVSIGVSFNKIFAKIGSDLKKPDATTVISKDNYKDILYPLPASVMLFAGPATVARLKKYSIETVGDVARADVDFLKTILGKNGETLWIHANGLEASPVRRLEDIPEVKSVSNGITAPHDLTTLEDTKVTLYLLCESVSARLREKGLIARTVKLGVRENDLHHSDHQCKMPIPGRTTKAIFDCCMKLLADFPPAKPIRALSVGAYDLDRSGTEQFSFFEDAENMRRQEKLETTIDNLRSKFGHGVISRGISMTDPLLANLDIKRARPASPECINE